MTDTVKHDLLNKRLTTMTDFKNKGRPTNQKVIESAMQYILYKVDSRLVNRGFSEPFRWTWSENYEAQEVHISLKVGDQEYPITVQYSEFFITSKPWEAEVIDRLVATIMLVLAAKEISDGADTGREGQG